MNQVGRLADLTNGEKQNDTRMLLCRRRPMVSPKWHLLVWISSNGQLAVARRRGHNKADGKLQHVDMTLFPGHITPGGEGQVAEGGKKTMVKDAIVEKIGLTFEQFTRAVLLAQNDFATFLKADDKQRAEILQVLTGTEKFEAISKAVFQRCGVEQKDWETLQSSLAGNEPLKEEARAEAEAVRCRADN